MSDPAKHFGARVGACLLVALVTGWMPAATLAAPVASEALQRQIELIDQEIVLLRAELAAGNGDPQALQRYLHQLEGMTLAPGFQARYEALKARSQIRQAETSVEEQESESVPKKGFHLPGRESQVVVLLPMTGAYAVAGEQVLAGLQDHWTSEASLVVLDSALYDTSFELWELAKLYSPDLIIGPLSKVRVQQWQALKTGVPTLYLNQSERLSVNEKALSPDKESSLIQLRQFLQSYGVTHFLILAKESQSADKLARALDKLWANSHSNGDYELHSVGASVDQGVRRALNVQRSRDRKGWLEKTIGHRLEFEPRPRQDIEAVIHLLPLDDAVQIKPLIDFFHQHDTLSLWYPPRLPEASDLHASLPFWQQTYAFLPPYLAQQAASDTFVDEQKIESGPLYALGKLAAETVLRSDAWQAGRSMGRTPLGELVYDASERFQLLPDVYWLDDQKLQPVTDYYFQIK